MTETAFVRIAVPSLDAMLSECARRRAAPRLPAAEWLMARGRTSTGGDRCWRDWLLDGAGLGADVLTRFPAGPCSAALAGNGSVAGNWARAEPVHLLAALDHLQLAAPVPLPLDPLESARLCADLNAHLAGTGFRLQPAAQGWLCACPDDVEWSALEPALALGRDLRERLPGGRDATLVRARVNELQMLLHDHPVNRRREERGLPVVNSVWMWGAGRAGERRGAASGVLATDDAWLAGAWRLHGGELRPAQRLADALREPGGDLRVAMVRETDAGGPLEWLTAIEREVLEPARAALLGRRRRHVALHTGATVLEVPASARWRFWRRPRPLVEVGT